MEAGMAGEEKIRKDALRWFFAAGAGAILLSLFIAALDFQLSDSKRELELRDALYELRMAEYSLPTGEIDPRQR